jgi:flavin-dependent dehydrogenase
MRDVLIIGGGLAGLLNALQLARAGFNVLLVEKKTYPFHKVCGEYVSNEVTPFLDRLGAFPHELKPAAIRRLLISSPAGRTLTSALPMGGFGVSRYALDHYLYQLAQAAGAEFRTGVSVQEVTFQQNRFDVRLSDGSVEMARLVIGAYGKRSHLDRQLERPFFSARSPYLAVKYHIRTEIPDDLIALHNFPDGYCGLSRIEDGKSCLCYLTSRSNLKKYGSIPEMEKQVVQQNPFLKEVFSNSEFLYEQPEAINEISFAPKQPVEQHILMSGDAAGLITPLCGNGMAMAIHSAKLLSELIVPYFRQNQTRARLEESYTQVWNNTFRQRLQVGRLVQNLFGQETVTEAAIGTLKRAPALTRFIIRQTHGKMIS